MGMTRAEVVREWGDTEANEVAHEAISCVRTVHSFAQEPYEQARYASRIQQYYELSIRQGFLDGMYFMGISCFLMQTVLQVLY
jgi:ABC-type multidrug transport system fused ATPase/permease subunit